MQAARTIFFLTIAFLLALTGCMPQPAAQPVTPTTIDPAANPPVIESVEILQSSDPHEILVIARATLPNTCLRLGEPTIERQGGLFTVNLPAVLVENQSCQSAALSQERVIRLPADAISSGQYAVLVNGALSSFRAGAPAPSATPVTDMASFPGETQPTATPPAEAPEPTATPPAEPTPTTQPPVREPAPTATPTAAPLALAVGEDPAECSNRAALHSILTVPDGTPFEPGATFTRTWLVLNAGSCTWGDGYKLIFAGGDPLGAPFEIPLPKAAPRQLVQVSVTLTAPIPPMKYESLWAFETPQGYRFGLGSPAVTPLSAKITVAARPAGVPSGLDCGALRLSDMEQEVLERINATRAEFGLYPLELVEDVSRVALKHSLEMACYDRWVHHGRDGMLYNVRLQRDGILFATSNEILYAGNGGPKGALDWWMDSKIHRPIVLTSEYTQIGIGYVYYGRNPYKQRITVDFIRP